MVFDLAFNDRRPRPWQIADKIDIEAPKDIVIDYNGILKPTGTTYTVPVGTASEDIQKMIDSMKDGDTLSFEKNGIYAGYYNLSN